MTGHAVVYKVEARVGGLTVAGGKGSWGILISGAKTRLKKVKVETEYSIIP